MATMDVKILLELVDKFSPTANKAVGASGRLLSAIKGTKAEISGLKQASKSVAYLQQLEGKMGKLTQKSGEAEKKVMALWRQWHAAKTAGKGTKALDKKIAAAQRNVARWRDKQAELNKVLDKTRAGLQAAGVATHNLGSAQAALAAKIGQVTAKLQLQQRALSGVRALRRKLHNTYNRLRGLSFMGMGAGAGAAAIGGNMLKTTAQFEQFQAKLETTEGSADKAKKAMRWISDFATQTPYELAEVNDAFVRLRAHGLDPTNGLMQTLGDTSSAMGKPIMAAVEAIADAVTGESERLKEFGIKGSSSDDMLEYQYTDKQGVQRSLKVAKDDRKAIEQALSKIWNEKFAGGMKRQSTTLLGIWSNIKDQWARFSVMVMNSGAFQYIKDNLQGVLATLDKMAANGQLQAYAELVGAKILEVLRAVKEIALWLYKIGSGLAQVGGFAAELVGGWQNLLAILVAIQVLPVWGLLTGAVGLMMANPFTAIILGAGLLVGALVAVYRNWDAIKAAFANSALGQAWSRGMAMLSAGWARFKADLATGWGRDMAMLSANWSRFKADLATGWSNIVTAFDQLKATLTAKWAAILAFMQSLPAQFVAVGQAIGQGLLNGINSMLGAIQAKFASLASSALASVKNALGIKSPSRAFAQVGQYTMAGLAQGVSRGSQQALGMVRRVGQALPAAAMAGGMAMGAPALAAPGAGGGTVQNISIHITQQPGENAQALAERVAALLKSRGGIDRRSHHADPMV